MVLYAKKIVGQMVGSQERNGFPVFDYQFIIRNGVYTKWKHIL